MYQSDSAIDAVAVSGCTKRPRCDAAYYHQCHRQFFRAWLGGDTGGFKGNGRAPGTSEWKEEKRRRRGVKGDVYFFDLKYIFVTAHSGKHHCVPQPVRKRKPGSDRWTGHGGDHSEYRGGGHFLQGDGEAN